MKYRLTNNKLIMIESITCLLAMKNTEFKMCYMNGRRSITFLKCEVCDIYLCVKLGLY